MPDRSTGTNNNNNNNNNNIFVFTPSPTDFSSGAVLSHDGFLADDRLKSVACFVSVFSSALSFLYFGFSLFDATFEINKCHFSPIAL